MDVQDNHIGPVEILEDFLPDNQKNVSVTWRQIIPNITEIDVLGEENFTVQIDIENNEVTFGINEMKFSVFADKDKQEELFSLLLERFYNSQTA